MKLASLEDLYMDNLQDVYDAEHQITDALPKMAKAASSSALRNGFEKHLQQTKEHIKRLEAVFENHSASPKRKTCKAMKGLISEGDEVMKENAAADVLDAALTARPRRLSTTRSPPMARCAPTPTCLASRAICAISTPRSRKRGQPTRS